MSLTRLFPLFFLMFSASSGICQGFLKAEGKRIVNDKGEVILRGMGLGGWMLQEPYMLKLGGVAVAQYEIRKKIIDLIGEPNAKEFYSAWLSNHCTKADIDSLAAWGFNSVRLPMHYNLYTLPVEDEKNGENTSLSPGFSLTDSLLSWCKSNKIYLILDLHAAPGGQGNDNAISDRDSTKPSLWQSEANRKKTVWLWQKLAERYANEEWIGAYDVLNEPNWGFQDPADKNGCAEKQNLPLKQLYTDITRAIRAVDKNHIIIIEGNCWGNNYDGMFPLWDNNMVLSFHKYWNLNDQASIKKFIDYRDTYKVPVWLGETGENSNVWFTDAISLVEKNKIGWNMWPLKKSGINNPMEVIVNPGYQDIINFWNGKGPKPDPATAFKSLMAFATNTKAGNTNVQKAVIDAMIRQVKDAKAIPFKQHKLESNAVVYAVDYDLGRSGDTYHDVDSANYWVSTTIHTSWNEGAKYRNDGVDIQSCTDSVTNGFNIGWIADGEWIQYSVYANEAASYNVGIRYAAAQKNGEMKLLLNGEASRPLHLSPTGSDQKWQTEIIKGARLAKGWNRLRVLAVKGGFNLNYFQFISTDKTENNSL